MGFPRYIAGVFPQLRGPTSQAFFCPKRATPTNRVKRFVRGCVFLSWYRDIVRIFRKVGFAAAGGSIFFFFFRTLILSSFWTSRGHRCRPFSPPVLAFSFIAHRVQQSHCSSIFYRVLLTHAFALSASQFVHKKKSQRIYTSMHSAGLELTKLTYTRLEDNLIPHRGDRHI